MCRFLRRIVALAARAATALAPPPTNPAADLLAEAEAETECFDPTVNGHRTHTPTRG